MIKLFHSGMVGAPVITNVAGSAITLLDAVLVNGWGSNTVDSVTITSGVATVTRAAGHPFEADTVSTISGATVTGGSINGEQKVLSASSTTYTFAATGISDQTATGTITHILAPLGFEKTFTGTNIAAYRSQNVASNRHYFRISDTGTTTARVVAYESMLGDVGTADFPTNAQVSGGAYFPKKHATYTPTWAIIGDDRSFYFSWWGGYTPDLRAARMLHFFGDINPSYSGDSYSSVITFSNSDLVAPVSSAIGTINELTTVSSSLKNSWITRNAYGVGSSQQHYTNADTLGLVATTMYSGGSTANNLNISNVGNNKIYLSPVYIIEVVNTRSNYRGTYPGKYFVDNDLQTSFNHLTRLTGVTNLSGRRLLALITGFGTSFIDLTGPWR